MKKNALKYILAALSIASLLTYCKDDSGDTLPEVKSSDTLLIGVTAKIGDTVWSPDYFVANKSNGFLSFTASADTGAYLAFSIAATEPGVYYFGSNTLNTAIFKPDIFGTTTYLSYGVSSNKESSKTVGTVYISTIDNDSLIVSGSFVFNMYNAKSNTYTVITQGTFNNVPLTTIGEINMGVKAIANEKNWLSNDKTTATLIDNSMLVMEIQTSDNELLEITLQKIAKTIYKFNQSSPNSAIFISQDPKIVYSTHGSIFSSGIVELSDTSKSLLSGKFIFTMHNPITKEEKIFRAGSFKNIKYKIKTRPSIIMAEIDGVTWTSPYTYAFENLDSTIQLVATDGLGKPIISLSVQKDTVNGTKKLEAFYYDNSGKIYLPQDGQIKYLDQDTIIHHILGTFSFDALNNADGPKVSVKNGAFEVYY